MFTNLQKNPRPCQLKAMNL